MSTRSQLANPPVVIPHTVPGGQGSERSESEKRRPEGEARDEPAR